MDFDFCELLEDFSPDHLHQCDQSIYAMRPDLTLSYVNIGWETFAVLNGEPEISTKWPIGRCVLDAMTTSFQSFFRTNFAACLDEMRPWGHRYECSSPHEFREFKMLVYPLSASQGILVVNSPVVCATKASNQSLNERYCNANGLITQCCQCKRIQNPDSLATWDWVPAWNASCPTNTSHGLCLTCFGFYYGSQRQTSRQLPRIFHTQE